MRLQHLTIGYGSTAVLSDITANVSEGTVVALLGLNGSGKSTLLRTIAGFQAPLAGSIHLQQEEGRDDDISRVVSIVMTHKPEADDMSVEELVSLARTPYTGFFGRLSQTDLSIVDEALAEVGIESLRMKKIGQLSDGECQKALIAKALAQQTPIILLDEPTAFLDYPSKVELMHLLMKLAKEQGKIILFSSHDIDLANHFADRLFLIHDGRFIDQPTATHIRAFLGPQAYALLFERLEVSG